MSEAPAPLPLIPEHAAILAKCGSAFHNAVQAKFDCTAILHNVEEAGSFGGNTRGVVRSEKRYSRMLSGGVEISVWKDDLTRHKVDAVVNAANERLQHGGGLAQALSEAGGPMIQKWSDDIIKNVSRVSTGEAVLTLAGYLPCKHIIHAVGPQLSPNPSLKEVEKATPLLYNAIRKSLELAVQNNLSSVAIPALSSGLFNFPRNLCADIMLRVIKQFHVSNALKNIEIHLVNNDEPSVQEMERATREAFDPAMASGSYSGAVQARSFSSSNTMQFGNVTLHLKKGAIEEERVDVIVNTIAEDCNLSLGEISKAILNKAGSKIQEEINRRKTPTHYSTQNVYVTKGHKLNCQLVYHTVCAPRSQYQPTQIIFNVVSECLRKAASGYKSISFPAIGTGNLGFKKLEVAQTMIDAVTQFAKQNKAKLDVYFVVFPKDDDMMKAFEKEMKLRNGETRSREARNDMTSMFYSGNNETTATKQPIVEFQGVSKEALNEAKVWTLNMLNKSNKITIHNNCVIYIGQKDHENLLFLQTMLQVHIEEFFMDGHGGISIIGSPSDVSCAAIEVEAMLCAAQREFARAEECDILYSVVRWSCKEEPSIQTPEISAVLEKAYQEGTESRVLGNYKVNFKSMALIDSTGKTGKVERKCLLESFTSVKNSFYARKPVNRNDPFEKAFHSSGLSIVKVEKLENIPLKQLFNMNCHRVNDKPKRLYQCVSAQFCDLICSIGFQKEFAPPAEQKYGSGIYFSSSVDGALKLWKEQEHEHYIYIIQAQVLTGKSTAGSPGFILPPALMGDPLKRYDSLYNQDTHVIFNGQQALPEYLIICDKRKYASHSAV